VAEGRGEAAPEVTEVIAALATPPGRGALGIVRLSGKGALGVARAFLGPGEIPPRRAVLRAVMDGAEVLDRALVSLYPEGSSYTGEETVEISAHGSPYVLGRILELCSAAGARPARPGEFTQRAFLNGRLDLTQAEAVCDLIAAQTRLAHRSAISRLEGGLSRKVGELRGRMVAALASIEAALDYPEEEQGAFGVGSPAGEVSLILDSVRALLAAARRGRALGGGARVAIVGRPNAGKSSLLNALLGRERAIVSMTPGTTRDAVSEPCDMGGLAAVLVDTAGMREGEPGDPLEAEGMRRAAAELSGADLALLVLDRAEPLAGQRALLKRLAQDARGGARPLVVALNKSDLPSRVEARSLASESLGASVVEVSALRESGLESLCEAVRAALAPGGCEGEACALALCARHAAAFEGCLRELGSALERLGCAEPELAAEHLRRALGGMDGVVGHSAPEDVLDAVFSRFCVGK